MICNKQAHITNRKAVVCQSDGFYLVECYPFFLRGSLLDWCFSLSFYIIIAELCLYRLIKSKYACSYHEQPRWSWQSHIVLPIGVLWGVHVVWACRFYGPIMWMTLPLNGYSRPYIHSRSVDLHYSVCGEIRNQKSEICLFNPFINYIEYSLIYIYKYMGEGDIS